MKSFIEECVGEYAIFDKDGFDEQKILKNSLSFVLPKIVENELTQKQRLCFEMFYLKHKKQDEIAKILRLSQPTVSRHIKSAENIINRVGIYCIYSIKKTSEQWEKLQ